MNLLTVCLFALALVGGTVVRAANHNSDSNSSNLVEKVADFELDTSEPADPLVLALMNPLNFYSVPTQASSGYFANVPLKLLKYIFTVYLNMDYKKIAQVNKFLYLQTRPMHYWHMKQLLPLKGEYAISAFNCAMALEADRLFRDNVLMYLTKLSGNMMEKWAVNIWTISDDSLLSAFNILLRRGKFAQCLTEEMMPPIRMKAIESVHFLKLACQEVDKNDSALFTMENLQELLLKTLPDLTMRKKTLAKLLISQPGLDHAVNILANSISQTVVRILARINLQNDSIFEILEWHKEYYDLDTEFMYSVYKSLSSVDEMKAAMYFVCFLCKKYFPFEVEYSHHHVYFLYDYEFCQRHGFRAKDFRLFLDSIDFNLKDLLAYSVCRLDTPWAQKLLKRWGELKTEMEKMNSLEFLVLTGRSLKESQDLLKSLSDKTCAEIAGRCHALSKYINDDQIAEILTFKYGSNAPKIGDCVAIYFWLPKSERKQFSFKLDREEFKSVVEMALINHEYEEFELLWEREKRVVYEIILEHVNLNPEFDSERYVPGLHSLLVITSSNQAYRNKHLIKVYDKVINGPHEYALDNIDNSWLLTGNQREQALALFNNNI